MTGMLASVANLEEARIVQSAGVDIVDLKNPAAGALGALPLASISTIVAELTGSVPISATIGDLPMVPEDVFSAVQNTAATGVDFVKIGFFPGGDWTGVIDALSAARHPRSRLIAVLFGDQQPDLDVLPKLANAGFTGAMLDTMDKSRGSLPQVCLTHFLGGFVERARALKLLCGLAGSLSIDDIPALLHLQPDYLGFRGALCPQHTRTSGLDPQQLETVLESMGRCLA